MTAPDLDTPRPRGAGTATAGAGGPGEVRHHGNRHRRSEQARLAVLEAADDLLVERGFADLTIEGIAARAGVAKQTIYRWWDSKSDILFDAFIADAEEFFTAPDHGDLGSDLRDHLGQLAAFLTTTDSGAVFRALAGRAPGPAARERGPAPPDRPHPLPAGRPAMARGTVAADPPPQWGEVFAVTPATLLAWHRRLVACKRDYYASRRPPTGRLRQPQPQPEPASVPA